ncbi:MAG: hypothetical protein FWC89_04965 [Defluviitaleaceae bacterium]|nr:hypothetical protein [Defluviitaleaceae bacterium]
MDTKNKHSLNVDALLRESMRTADKPDAALLQKVKFKLSMEENMQKKYEHVKSGGHIFTKVAMFIAATIALTVTVLGVGIYLGSFDHLRRIIGDDHADLLQPLGITMEATTLEVVTDSGIHVELVAVGVFDNIVDVYVTLEDLRGKRFANLPDEGFRIIQRLFSMEVGSFGGGTEILYRSDDGRILTFRSRTAFSQSVEGMRLQYSLIGIQYNMVDYFDLDVDIRLDDAVPQPSILFIANENPMLGGGGFPDEYYMQVAEKLQAEGVAVLQPHLHNISLGMEGINAYISSIGIIENRLHIQLHEPFPYRGTPWSNLWLRNVNHEMGSTRHLRFDFGIDSYGNAVSLGPIMSFDEAGVPTNRVSIYTEYVFELDLEQLSNYKLSGNFRNADEIMLLWLANFEVQNSGNIIVDELSLRLETCTLTGIRINPFFVNLLIEVDRTLFSTDLVRTLYRPEIIINTHNGAIHLNPADATLGGFEGLGERGINGFVYLFYPIGVDPLDINSIISIEIDGEIITIS